MVQEHGLGARPYDCSKCTLKFFFTTELDHHILTFHRPGESSSPAENAHETKDRNIEAHNCDGNVAVKEEVMHVNEEEEEEEVNVDDRVAQEEREDTSGHQRDEQKLKTEIDNETASGKTESWLSSTTEIISITFRSDLDLNNSWESVG